ncbi:hypothetical protein [Nocardioides panacisoli]|uniref:FHA domain-containing protein n=1 Tax=Nocardioides panacisoli TaxID=627624 RepID=A0ABP7IEE4_9ACTN
MSEMSTSSGWSYQAGSWFAVFGPQVTVLLPESERERVIRVWATVDEGGGFDQVLDGLLATGLSSLPGFVLLGAEGGPTRVLLRGADVTVVLATGDGEVALDGSASATWVEQSVDGVTGVRIEVGADSSDDVHFPITTGLVRVGRVDRPAVASGAAGVVEPETAEEVEAAVGETPPVFEAQAEPVGAAGPVAEAEPSDDAAVALPGTDVVGADAPIPVVTPSAEPAPMDVPAADLPADVPADDAPADDVPADDAPAADPGLDLQPTEQMPPVSPDTSLAASELELPPPLGADPLTDPMPPQEPAPSNWVTPWDPPAETAAPPVPEDAPAPEAAPVEEPAVEEPAPEASVPDAPAADEPPAPAYPPPPVDGPSTPPPLGIGSWEPVGGFPPPPPAPDTDHDGLTVGGADHGQVPPPPGIPGQPPAPPVTQPVANLMISDGQNVVVDRVILIGRAPEARRFSSTEQPLLVSVPSRLHEISATHVEVRPGTGADHGSAVVTDMGSTNGTVLVQPGLGPEDLKPGIAVQLIPGAIINLGDGITIQVTRP